MNAELSELELYRSMMQLAPDDDPDKVLPRVLQLAVAATSARLGFLATGDSLASPEAFWIEGHPANPEALRERVSTTVLRVAREEGELVVTHDAQVDPRFRGGTSVRRHRIEQVLCAPLPGGVFYLQGRTRPGPFAAAHVAMMRGLVRQLGPLLVAHRQRRQAGDDPTRPFRKRLAADALLGRSEAIAQVLARVAQVAPLDISVLITGPSGAGKTLLARVIHDNGRRAPAPFVSVNCASLRPDRLHADLFGAAPGAYTGQRGAREGLVGAAEGGTLFLDEVAELPPEAQAQLLTFLHDGRYRRLGEERPRQASVRVIAATSADLSDATRFREDLYWRLSAVPIHLPGLRERLDDVPLLVPALSEAIARELQLAPLPVSPAAIAELETLPWPGNIRELRQRLLSALLWAHGVGARSIRPEHLVSGRRTSPRAAATDLRSAMESFKRRHVLRVLDACGGNRTRAAEALGLHRTYLHDLLARWQVSGGSDT